MLNESKDYVEFGDVNRVSRLLEIACNMHKCKYALMNDLTLNGEKTPIDTTILINFQSILIDWFKLCGDEADYSRITSEEIACRLLEVVSHYRRFYEDYGKCEKTWVFCYGSRYNYRPWIQSKIQTIIPDCMTDSQQEEIWNAIRMIQKISEYIPGFYIRWDDEDATRPLAVYPQYIVSSMTQKSLDARSIRHQRVFISSGNEMDFFPLILNDVRLNFRIYGFKRKHPTIFTYNTIMTKLIYRKRKTPIIPLHRFLETYVAVLFSQFHKMGEVCVSYARNNQIAEVQSFISKELLRLNGLSLQASQLGTDEFLSKIKERVESNSEIRKIYEFFDIPKYTKSIFSKLQSEQVFWKIDMIDYSIDILNEYQFKHFKVDFKSLF